MTGGPGAARTPRRSRALAATRSPSVARLIGFVNQPSDNYAADSLFRLVGAKIAGDGSGAGGARAVKRTIRKRFGFAPAIESGSGETLKDKTSPREVVALLSGIGNVPKAPPSRDRSRTPAGTGRCCASRRAAASSRTARASTMCSQTRRSTSAATARASAGRRSRSR